MRALQTFYPATDLIPGGIAFVYNKHLAMYPSVKYSDGHTFCGKTLEKTDSPKTMIRWDEKPIKVCRKCCQLWRKWGGTVNSYLLVENGAE